MSVLQALYDQSPATVWLAVGGLLIALELATGSARLTPAALAALVPAGLALAHLPLGWLGETVAFLTVAGAAMAFARLGPSRLGFASQASASDARLGRPAHGLPTPRRAKPSRPARPRAERPPESPAAPAAPGARKRSTRRGERVAVLNLDGGDTPTLDALKAAQPSPAGKPIPVAKPKPAAVAKPAKAAAPLATVASPADPQRARRLVGATGRTTGEFANGVGRVWLDGSEWGAELDHGEDLEGDRAVEVVSVSGGVRLTVRPLPLPA